MTQVTTGTPIKLIEYNNGQLYIQQ